MSTVGERIYKQRKAKGLTQEALAEEIGYSEKRNICNYEKNIRQPDLKTLVKIADALSCTTDYLLGKEKEPTRAETDLSKATGLSSEAVAFLVNYWKTTDEESIQHFLSDMITSTHLVKIALYYQAWRKETIQPENEEERFLSEVSRLFEEGKYTPEIVRQINENLRKAYCAPLTVEGLRYSIKHAFESFLTETEQKGQKKNKEV